jgi:hypothetical protein
VTDEKMIGEAAKLIRHGDNRVDISLRGPLADLLSELEEHADSEYACCDNGVRQCYEIGGVTMNLVDAILKPFTATDGSSA